MSIHTSRRAHQAAAVAAATVLLAACGSDAHGAARTTTSVATTSSAPASTSAPTATPPTSAPTTVPATTTTVLPRDLQSSPDAASGTFIRAWEAGDRAAAAKVATGTALAALFAEPYRGQVLNDRGCVAPGPNPVVCTWGPYAEASPKSPVYDITVKGKGSAWYVSAAQKLS